MARLSALRSDLTKEKLGIWVAWELGIRFRIARMNNPSYDAAVREALRPHRDRIRRGVMDEREIERLSLQAVATHILTGWENVDDDDGKPIEYSPEKSAEIIGDPRYRDVYDFVIDCSRRAALYRVHEMETDLGNSSPVSTGTSSGDSTPSS